MSSTQSESPGGGQTAMGGAAAPAAPPTAGETLFPTGGAGVNTQQGVEGSALVDPVGNAKGDTVAEPTGEVKNDAAPASDTGSKSEEPKPEGEAKPDEAKPPEGDDAPVKEAAGFKDFTLPEGVTIDGDQLGKFKETAAKFGLSQNQAQELVALAADGAKNQATTSAEAFAKAQSEAWAATTNSWRETLESDSELGGQNKAKVQTAIARALDEYGSPATRQAFDLTGAGDHPEIVRWAYRMAAALSEGTSIRGGGPAPRGPQTPGATLYGGSEEGQ